MPDEKYSRIVPGIVQQLLKERGLSSTDIEKFIYPDYSEDLADPFLMRDMNLAVDRIILAAERGDKVVVYGDYDIDGITAATVLETVLVNLGIEVTSYIPDRFEEGYGINKTALIALQKDGADLIISVDCGITSLDESTWAIDNKLDLIITDHHNVPDRLPTAIAVINPKQDKDKYPFKELSGVGVVFTLVRAIQQRTGIPAAGQEKWLLDLVALGTICDVVDLVGENRVLVHFGLQVLRRTPRPGLKALAKISDLDPKHVRSEDVAFSFGPRLNAAGRLEHARDSLELLQTPSDARATELSISLDKLNQQRRVDQASIVKGALSQSSNYSDDPVLVLADSNWNHGIVGIAAAKVMEQTGKPTIILQIMGKIAKGSARSNGSFNMVEGLGSVSQYLDRFGGHFYAAGCTLPTSNIEKFRHDLNVYFHDSGGKPKGVTELKPDLEIDEPNIKLYEDLELLQPFGAGNKKPILEVPGLELLEAKPVGDGSHLKLAFRCKGKNMGGIGFGIANLYKNLQVGSLVNVVGYLGENNFNGTTRLQLQVLEIRHK